MANKDCNYDVKQAGINIEIIKRVDEVIQLMETVDCNDAKKKLTELKELVINMNPYAVSKSTPLSGLLQTIVDETVNLDFTKPESEGKLVALSPGFRKMTMISSTGQVQLLQFLMRQLKCRNILEVGTYMGYGAFGMADAMAPGGKVTGIDIEPYFCDFVNKTAHERNLNVEVKQGAAIPVLESLAKEGKTYDFIYIDCVKTEYCDYFKIIMDNDMLLPNGMIACDNVIWDGTVITRSDNNGRCLDDFNNMVVQDKRVTSAMLPCFDGLLFIQHSASVE